MGRRSALLLFQVIAWVILSISLYCAVLFVATLHETLAMIVLIVGGIVGFMSFVAISAYFDLPWDAVGSCWFAAHWCLMIGLAIGSHYMAPDIVRNGDVKTMRNGLDPLPAHGRGTTPSYLSCWDAVIDDAHATHAQTNPVVIDVPASLNYFVLHEPTWVVDMSALRTEQQSWGEDGGNWVYAVAPIVYNGTDFARCRTSRTMYAVCVKKGQGAGVITREGCGWALPAGREVSIRHVRASPYYRSEAEHFPVAQAGLFEFDAPTGSEVLGEVVWAENEAWMKRRTVFWVWMVVSAGLTALVWAYVARRVRQDAAETGTAPTDEERPKRVVVAEAYTEDAPRK